MSAAPPVAIGTLVASVKTWTPERDDPDGTFMYIDLSAVPGLEHRRCRGGKRARSC